MMFLAFAIALAALLAHLSFASTYTLANGGFSNGLHLIDFRNVGHLLLARQLDQGPVPTQCDSICNPVIASLKSCTTAECCTPGFHVRAFECFTCLGEALGSTNFSESQSAVDGLYNSCTELGYQLPILTFPGQDANRPLSSLPSSAISTSRSRSQTTGTTLVNPFATISQTAITSLPGPLTTTEPSTTPTTESTTTSSPTATTSSGKKIIGGTALRAWVQVMEILVVCFSII